MLLNFYRLPPVGMKHGFRNTVASYWYSLRGKSDSVKFQHILSHHASYFGSGKSALTTALTAISELKSRKKEVIIPAYTCFSVAAAVEQAGLKLVLCDVNPETLDFNYDHLTKVFSKHTLCVIPTQLFGLKTEIDKTIQLARANDSFTILDAAQSIVVPEIFTKHEVDVLLFSFGRGKPISTLAGGMLATTRQDIAQVVDNICKTYPIPTKIDDLAIAVNVIINDLLINPSLYWIPSNLPFLGIGETIYPTTIRMNRLGAFRSYLLGKQLAKKEFVTSIRKKNANEYVNRLNNNQMIKLVKGSESAGYAPVRFPVLLNKPITELTKKQKLNATNMGIVSMYPSGINKIDNIRNFWLNDTDDFDGANWVSHHLLTLPTHQWITEQKRNQIIEFLLQCN